MGGGRGRVSLSWYLGVFEQMRNCDLPEDGSAPFEEVSLKAQRKHHLLTVAGKLAHIQETGGSFRDRRAVRNLRVLALQARIMDSFSISYINSP